MTEIFTDVNGHHHRHTVPRGLVQPGIWSKHRAFILPSITAPFRTLLLKTTNPFVTKVYDVICPTATFHDGRVILVGDAFTSLRPHIGAATEQAAFQSNLLNGVYDGESTLTSWNKQVCLFAERMVLLGRIVAEIGTGTTISVLKWIIVFIIFSLKEKLGWFER